MSASAASRKGSDPAAIDEALRSFFEPHAIRVAAVYLFGGAARGELRPASDVDVAVLFREDPPRTLDGLHLDWAADLARHLGRPVDLVVLNFATADLAHHVRLDGRVVIDHDPGARIAHEVASRNQYFDLLPHIRRYRHPETVQ